jgi:hypothetical protein
VAQERTQERKATPQKASSALGIPTLRRSFAAHGHFADEKAGEKSEIPDLSEIVLFLFFELRHAALSDSIK